MDSTTLTAPTTAASDYLAFAQHGDAAALERALLACADQAYTQARRQLGNAADADDAVQEAFLQLTRQAKRFDGTIPFAAWVGRLVQVAGLRVRRSDRRRRRREEAAMAEQRSVSQPTVQAELAEAVRARVERLPQADRAVIELHYFADLSQAETAAALNTSENAVALRLSRARTRLRDMLGPRGSALDIAGIASALAAQPGYAASPMIITAAHTWSATVAAGTALPTTTVSVSFVQKGLLLMSAHPIATVLCAILVSVAGLLPTTLWSGDAKVVLPPPPAPVVAGPSYWQGAARALLPCIDPQAPFTAAVDGESLLRLGATTKPTSLLADPRAAPVVAHIRQQLQLWAATDGDMPDLGELFAQARGAVFSMGIEPLQFHMVAESSSASMTDLGRRLMRELHQDNPNAPSKSLGSFSGFELEKIFIGFDNGRIIFGRPSAVESAVQRLGQKPPPPPAQCIAPAWASVDVSPFIAAMATLDPTHSDPLHLAHVFGPSWWTAKPIAMIRMLPGDQGWRGEVDLSGVVLPLRTPTPAIAGCVPAGALASAVFAVDPVAAGKLINDMTALSSDVFPKQVRRTLDTAGIDVDWANGDVACVVQPQSPIPAVTIVVGLRTGTANQLAPVLGRFLRPYGFTETPMSSGALFAWGGAMPFGMVQVVVTDDRLIVTTGDSASFIAPPSRTCPSVLEARIDLPAIAKLYLPLLYALMPAQSPFLFGTPLARVVYNLQFMSGRDGRFNLDEDQVGALPGLRRMAQRADVRTSECIAMYAPKNYTGDNSRVRVVYRVPKGWCMPDFWPRRLVKNEILNRETLAQRLAGLERIAGSEPDQLVVLAIGDQPTFDRRWLPDMAAVIDHLPQYHLTVSSDATGLHLREDGLPFAAGWVTAVGAVLLADVNPEREYRGAVMSRDREMMRNRHQQALAAIKRVSNALKNRGPDQPPVLKASEALAVAGVPFTDLASSPVEPRQPQSNSTTWDSGIRRTRSQVSNGSYHWVRTGL